MALGSTFGIMAILLAETLITLGASLQRWCQLQETGVPFTQSIILQPAVVTVVGIWVVETLTHSCCHRVGVSAADNRPMEEATCSAGRAKKDWGRCWEVVVAIGVA